MAIKEAVSKVAGLVVRRGASACAEDLAKLERLHADAVAEHSRIVGAPPVDELDQVADGDLTAMMRHAEAIEVAARKIQMLDAAVVLARQALAAAQRREHGETMARAWQIARSRSDVHLLKVQELQDAIDVCARAYVEMLNSAEALFEAVPDKPNFRPAAFTLDGLQTFVSRRMFAQSGGRLGSSVHSVYMTGQDPSLVDRSTRDVDTLFQNISKG